MNTDWNDLIQRYIAGHTTEEETRRLETALKADDTLADLYLRHTELDVALEAEAASAEVTRELLTAPGLPETRRTFSWLSWRPLTAAAAGIVLGMFGTSVVFGYVMPRAVAMASQLLALVDGSFEAQRGPLPAGFPSEFGVWSGWETEFVEKGPVKALEGKRMLRFVRSSEFPAMGTHVMSISSLICALSASVSRMENRHWSCHPGFWMAELRAGDPIRFILRLYVFSGSPDSLREKWPMTWRNAMTLPEALSTGNTLLQSGGARPDDWRDVKAKALLPPNAEFALVHVGVYQPRAPNGVPLEFGSQFVDDVRLTLTTQPVLPVRVVQR